MLKVSKILKGASGQLYHATFAAYESKIRERGLIPGGEKQLYSWCDPTYVYLADQPVVAESFVSPGVVEAEDVEAFDDLFDEGGLLLTIQIPRGGVG